MILLAWYRDHYTRPLTAVKRLHSVPAENVAGQPCPVHTPGSLYSARVTGVARLLAAFFALVLALAACGSTGDISQIKSVIEKSNHEQEDAFAAHDPSIMQDTFTASGFAYMVRTNDILEQEGTVGIRLLKLEWGSVKMDSDSAAEAETWETWEQTDEDGNTYQSRDRNYYKLLKIGSSWKINEVSYPDRPDQEPQPSGQPGSVTPGG
jgi:hypothetical protein